MLFFCFPFYFYILFSPPRFPLCRRCYFPTAPVELSPVASQFVRTLVPPFLTPSHAALPFRALAAFVFHFFLFPTPVRPTYHPRHSRPCSPRFSPLLAPSRHLALRLSALADLVFHFFLLSRPPCAPPAPLAPLFSSFFTSSRALAPPCLTPSRAAALSLLFSSRPVPHFPHSRAPIPVRPFFTFLCFPRARFRAVSEKFSKNFPFSPFICLT